MDLPDNIPYLQMFSKSLRQVMVHQSELLHWSLKCGGSDPKTTKHCDYLQTAISLIKGQFHPQKINVVIIR